LTALFKASPSPNTGELSYQLENLVNLTDFVELGTLLRMFEVDMLDFLVDKLRSQTSIGMTHTETESLARIKDSINAKYS